MFLLVDRRKPTMATRTRRLREKSSVLAAPNARNWRGRRRKSGGDRIRVGGFRKSETNWTCAGRLLQAKLVNSAQSACSIFSVVFHLFG